MANYKVTDAELISVADAIRMKGGTAASLVFPSGFVSAVQDLSAGFSVADEGKVVASGALSIQGVMSVSENSVYDTTLFSQVNVSIPEATLVSKTISENGTYYPASDNADGFSQVVVDVSSGGGGGVDNNVLIMFGMSSGVINESFLTSIPTYGFYYARSDFGYGISGYIGQSVLGIGNSAFQNCDMSIASFPLCTKIGSYAFNYCNNLESISFPKCISILNNAFEGCSKLTALDFPECQTIENNAFKLCSSVSTINFPACISIGQDAFRDCKSLRNIVFEECVSAGMGVFSNISSMQTASFPKLRTLGGYAFYCCYNLSELYMPLCEIIGMYAFYSCSKISGFIFNSAVSSVGYDAFYGCSSLSFVKFMDNWINGGGEEFGNCNALASVYFLGSSIISHNNTNRFRGTPIVDSSYLGYFGSIYVPASLVDSYKVHSKWSSYADRITAYVEG